jgi:glycosyltransferase involved in cell wall biosynthesis
MNAGDPPPLPAGEGRRVLLVAPQPVLANRGTPLNVLQVCRALIDSGHEVHLLAIPLGENDPPAGVTCHFVGRLPFVRHVPTGFSLGKMAYDALLAVRMTALLTRRRFAMVHAIEEAAFFAVPLARLFRTPAITDLDSDICQQLAAHPSVLARSLAGTARVLRRHALRRSAAAVTVAGHLSGLVASESPATPIFEIPDIPVDAAMREPDMSKAAALGREVGVRSKRLAVYTGNLDPRQGIGTLIDALPLVRQRVPDAELLVVGGERREIEVLRRAASDRGVTAAVHFAGSRPLGEMPEFMALASVLVSPRLEPLVTPLKIYTYMSSGRPIVATDLPTHRVVLDEESAVLVPPTPEGLADGIARVMQRPEEASALACRARELVLREHNYERFRRQIAEMYARLAAEC